MWLKLCIIAILICPVTGSQMTNALAVPPGAEPSKLSDIYRWMTKSIFGVAPPAALPPKEGYALFWDCCEHIGETVFGITIKKPIPPKEEPSRIEKVIRWVEENIFGVTPLPPDPPKASPCMTFLGLLKTQISWVTPTPAPAPPKEKEVSWLQRSLNWIYQVTPTPAPPVEEEVSWLQKSLIWIHENLESYNFGPPYDGLWTKLFLFLGYWMAVFLLDASLIEPLSYIMEWFQGADEFPDMEGIDQITDPL
ncbi:uncharacterized protein LOC142701752 [Rhinoderma darwinii]|uniref:uncharacterized protein LOC142701752 n=1 Tax=Rhinoderma darwinii TaxID=43563 RepID=UPI003F674EE3